MLVSAFQKLKQKIRFSIRLTVVAVFVLATSLTALIAISLQYYFSEKMALEASVKNFNLATGSVADYLTGVNEKSENTLFSLMLFVNIGEHRCTVCQNAPSARLSALRPPVRPSARAGAGRTYIHKTPDRTPWAAVNRIC